MDLHNLITSLLSHSLLFSYYFIQLNQHSSSILIEIKFIRFSSEINTLACFLMSIVAPLIFEKQVKENLLCTLHLYLFLLSLYFLIIIEILSMHQMLDVRTYFLISIILSLHKTQYLDFKEEYSPILNKVYMVNTDYSFNFFHFDLYILKLY